MRRSPGIKNRPFKGSSQSHGLGLSSLVPRSFPGWGNVASLPRGSKTPAKLGSGTACIPEPVAGGSPVISASNKSSMGDHDICRSGKVPFSVQEKFLKPSRLNSFCRPGKIPLAVQAGAFQPSRLNSPLPIVCPLVRSLNLGPLAGSNNNEVEQKGGVTMAEVLEVFGGRVLQLDSLKRKWNTSNTEMHVDDDQASDEFDDRCPNSSMYARYIVEEKGKESRIRLVPLRCKSWACPYCAKINARTLYNKINRGIAGCLDDEKKHGYRDEYALKFLTLTLPGREWRDATSREDAEEVLKYSFKKTISQLRRKLGHIEYCWVMEFQKKDGYAHLHVVLVGHAIAPKSVLEDIEQLWRKQQQMGFIRLNAVTGGVKGISSYLSKYLTKEIGQGSKSSRVFGASAGFYKAVSNQKPLITMIERGRFTYDNGKYFFSPLWTISDTLSPALLVDQLKIEQEEIDDLYLQMQLPFD